MRQQALTRESSTYGVGSLLMCHHSVSPYGLHLPSTQVHSLQRMSVPRFGFVILKRRAESFKPKAHRICDVQPPRPKQALHMAHGSGGLIDYAQPDP